MSSNPTGCCGVKTTCCSDPVPQNLTVTCTNACGTFTGSLNYSSAANGGNGGWVGTLSMRCKPNLFAPCGSSFDLSITMYCTPSGYYMSTNLGSGQGGTGGTCSPFSFNFTFAVNGCAPQHTFNVKA